MTDLALEYASGRRRLTPAQRATAKMVAHLTKRGEVFHNWKRRLFVMIQSEEMHLLFYYKGEGDEVPAGVINLDGAMCKRVSELQFSKKYCFSLISRASYTGSKAYTNREFFIECPNNVSRERWMTAITSPGLHERVSSASSLLDSGRISLGTSYDGSGRKSVLIHSGPPVLYHSPKSRSICALWTLYELHSEFDLNVVELGTTERFVDGSTTLLESGAIVLYLLEKHQKHRLIPPPADPQNRATFFTLFYWTNNTFDEAILPVSHQFTSVAENERDEQLIENASKRFHEELAPLLEKQLQESGGPFLLGRNFTGVDIVLGFSLGLCHDLGLLERHATLVEYREQLLRRRSIRLGLGLAPLKEAVSARPVDFLVTPRKTPKSATKLMIEWAMGETRTGIVAIEGEKDFNEIFLTLLAEYDLLMPSYLSLRLKVFEFLYWMKVSNFITCVENETAFREFVKCARFLQHVLGEKEFLWGPFTLNDICAGVVLDIADERWGWLEHFPTLLRYCNHLRGRSAFPGGKIRPIPTSDEKERALLMSVSPITSSDVTLDLNSSADEDIVDSLPRLLPERPPFPLAALVEETTPITFEYCPGIVSERILWLIDELDSTGSVTLVQRQDTCILNVGSNESVTDAVSIIFFLLEHFKESPIVPKHRLVETLDSVILSISLDVLVTASSVAHESLFRSLAPVLEQMVVGDQISAVDICMYPLLRKAKELGWLGHRSLTYLDKVEMLKNQM